MASALDSVSGSHQAIRRCGGRDRGPAERDARLAGGNARSAGIAGCGATQQRWMRNSRPTVRIRRVRPLQKFCARQHVSLFEAGDKQSARKILEFVFAREIEEHKLVAANFLGLAEIRLASGDTTGALDLLRRLVVAVGNPFENLDPAAALLEKIGHNAEAIEFLDQLVKSAPWDPSYRLRLAKAKLTAGQDSSAAQEALATVAAAPTASYDLRLKAAAAIGGRPHSNLGSGELNLLAAATQRSQWQRPTSSISTKPASALLKMWQIRN